jgi:hypothetical protein
MLATKGAQQCEIQLQLSVPDLVASHSPVFYISMASQQQSTKLKSRQAQERREACSIFTNITVRSPSKPQGSLIRSSVSSAWRRCKTYCR